MFTRLLFSFNHNFLAVDDVNTLVGVVHFLSVEVVYVSVCQYIVELFGLDAVDNFIIESECHFDIRCSNLTEVSTVSLDDIAAVGYHKFIDVCNHVTLYYGRVVVDVGCVCSNETVFSITHGEVVGLNNSLVLKFLYGVVTA